MPKSTNDTPSDTPATQVQPEPVLEKRIRRSYDAAYKMSIIAQADACQHGELGALLRREKLYRKQLSTWRRELAEEGVAGLQKTVSGPQASKTAEQRRVKQLEKDNIRLSRELNIANDCLALQKKALSMVDHLNNGSNV